MRERERKKKKTHQEPEKPASSPWPPLELSFQLNDNRFCLRNCYVIWCMGVIWLRTRDRSTSHKILPEFSDLCVMLLLLCATCPIYLLQKYKVKDKPGNLKATESLLNPFSFRKHVVKVKSMFYVFTFVWSTSGSQLKKLLCEFI